MKALVVNCSRGYSLGAAKLADWLAEQGYQVDAARGDPGMFAWGYDLVCLSVVFSWDAPLALEIARRVKGNSEVWCGGPGMFALGNWWKRETGLDAQRGLDARFEKQRGRYKHTFATRGCPVGCWFCIVPKLEGTEFSFDWDFQPAPTLCDNNLSALPVEYQEHIIRRYQETETPLLDANSGFEPKTFDGATYERWRGILRGPWRFALDESAELPDVERMMRVLADLPRGRKRVYVLIGNEPMEACYERAMKVIEWGGEPFCQPVMKLNTLVKQPLVRHDWTEQALHDFARYFNRPALWKTTGIQSYRPRRWQRPPFAAAAWAEALGAGG